MNSKKYFSALAVMVVIAGVALASPVLADTSGNSHLNQWHQTNQSADQLQGTNNHDDHGGPDRGRMQGGQGMMRPGISGTVASVSGTTLSVTGRQGMGSTTATATTTFTVDASNATVRKNNATSTLSNVLVGDKVFVEGTVTGNTVVATSVLDGVMGMRGGGMGHSGTSTPAADDHNAEHGE